MAPAPWNNQRVLLSIGIQGTGLVDTVAGKIIDDDELKERYADKQPYGEWIDRYMVNLKDLKIPNQRVPEYTKEERQRMQRAFSYI